MQKKALVGTVIVLLALMMFVLSLVMPWYMYEMKMSSLGEEESMSVEYYLDHAEADFGIEKDEKSYDDEDVKDYNFVKTFKTTQIMAFLGILGCFIGIVGAALVTSEKIKGKAGALFILIAVLLSLIAPLYLMFTLPSAFKEDTEESSGVVMEEEQTSSFFGSEEDEILGIKVEVSWGGSSGWFLAFFAAIISIIALILVAISRPAPAQEMFFTPAPMIPQPTVQPQFEGSFSPQIQGPQMQIAPAPTASIPPAAHREEFQCPECNRIFILPPARKPVIARCPYCGLEGLVE